MTSTTPGADRALRAWALTHARSVGRGGTPPEPAAAARRPSRELIPGSTRLNIEDTEAQDVTCMDICAVPGGPLLVATGTRKGLVRVWDGQTGRLLRTIPGRSAVRSVVWNAYEDRALLVVQSQAGAGIWDGLTAALLIRVHDSLPTPWDLPHVRPIRGIGRFLFGPQQFSVSAEVWGPGGRYGELRPSSRSGPLWPVCGVASHSGRTFAVCHASNGTLMYTADDADARHGPTSYEVALSKHRATVASATPALGDEGVLVAMATMSQLLVSRVTSTESTAVVGHPVKNVTALDWLALSGQALLAVGHENGSLSVMSAVGPLRPYQSGGLEWHVETYPCGRAHAGIGKATWCMTPGREPMVAVLCNDLTVWRQPLPFAVPRDRLPPPPADALQSPGTTEPSETAPPPLTLRVDPACLVALGKADLWPPLSLVEDLVALTGKAPVVALHDPRFAPFADHPGFVRLRGLAWPDRARVGFVGLLAAGTEQIPGCVPPPECGDQDRVAVLRDRLASGPGPRDVPFVSLPPVAAAADTVTDRMIALLTVLGPETVQADPSLPLLLARAAADMPQLDSRQLRILSAHASDGSARTRTTVHAPGTSGTSNRGTLTHLLPTQLALPRQVLLLKHSRHELLFRLHVTEADPMPGDFTLVLDTSPPTFGPVEGLLRAAAHVITAELWRYGRHPHLVTFDQPSQVVPIARPTDLLALWTTRTLDLPDVARALKTAAVTGVPTLLLTHHRLPRELGLTPNPHLRLLTTHLADDAPAGRWTLPFQQHVPPSPHPAQLQKAISTLLMG